MPEPKIMLHFDQPTPSVGEVEPLVPEGEIKPEEDSIFLNSIPKIGRYLVKNLIKYAKRNLKSNKIETDGIKYHVALLSKETIDKIINSYVSYSIQNEGKVAICSEYNRAGVFIVAVDKGVIDEHIKVDQEEPAEDLGTGEDKDPNTRPDRTEQSEEKDDDAGDPQIPTKEIPEAVIGDGPDRGAHPTEECSDDGSGLCSAARSQVPTK